MNMVVQVSLIDIVSSYSHTGLSKKITKCFYLISLCCLRMLYRRSWPRQNFVITFGHKILNTIVCDTIPVCLAMKKVYTGLFGRVIWAHECDRQTDGRNVVEWIALIYRNCGVKIKITNNLLTLPATYTKFCCSSLLPLIYQTIYPVKSILHVRWLDTKN